jgi:hypothetical protein
LAPAGRAEDDDAAHPGALTAGVAVFLLLGFGGAHLPTAGMLAGKVAGAVV